VVVLEQTGIAGTALDTVNEMIANMTKTAVFFSLYTGV
jgi:hypothetical protein